MRTAALVFALLAVGTAPVLHGQDASAAEPSLPTCASLGTPRLAVMLPPDADTAQVRASLAGSGAIPDDYTVLFIDRRRAPPLRDIEEAELQIGRLLRRLVQQEMQVRGEALSVVSVDASGEIASVEPGSGNVEVDRALRLFWRGQMFRPPVIGGCRGSAWVRVAVRFDVQATGTRVLVDYPALRRRAGAGQ